MDWPDYLSNRQVNILTKLAEGECAVSMLGNGARDAIPSLRYRGLVMGGSETYVITDVGRELLLHHRR